MGDANMSLVSALTDVHGLRFVSARHEQGATAMADGYSRASNTVGVCTVTRGPGLLNASTSLAVARAHGTPLVMLAGDRPTNDPDHVQAIDQPALALATAGRTVSLESSRDAAALVRGAFEQARSAAAPVVVNLPSDVLIKEAETGAARAHQALPPRSRGLQLDGDAVAAAASALRRAVRPAILAGRGAVLSGARDSVIELATLLGAPIFTTLRASGLAGRHPLAAGNAGQASIPERQRLLASSDCLLVVGSSLSPFSTKDGRFTRQKVIVRIDSDERVIGRDGGIEVLADAREAVLAICAELRRTRSEASPRVVRSLPRFHFVPEHGAGSVDPRSALLAIEAALPRRRALVLDAGHFLPFAGALLSVAEPEDWFLAADLGTIGQSLATGLGVAAARPSTSVNVICGDGGFLMGIAELETAVRHGLNVTVFVLNDGGYGQEIHMLELEGRSPRNAILPTPDIAAVARAYGASGYRIAAEGQLSRLRDILERADGPTIVEIIINSRVRNWEIEELRAASGALAAQPAVSEEAASGATTQITLSP